MRPVSVKGRTSILYILINSRINVAIMTPSCNIEASLWFSCFCYDFHGNVINDWQIYDVYSFMCQYKQCHDFHIFIMISAGICQICINLLSFKLLCYIQAMSCFCIDSKGWQHRGLFIFNWIRFFRYSGVIGFCHNLKLCWYVFGDWKIIYC